MRTICNGMPTLRRIANGIPINADSCLFCRSGPDEIEHYFSGNCTKINQCINQNDRQSFVEFMLLENVEQNKEAICWNYAIYRTHLEMRKNDRTIPDRWMTEAIRQWKIQGEALATPKIRKKKTTRPPLIDDMPNRERLITIFLDDEFYRISDVDEPSDTIRITHPNGTERWIPFSRDLFLPPPIMHAYTDGSCIKDEERTSSSWGFSILGQENFVIDGCGKVCHDNTSPFFIAECADTNNCGELSALFHLLKKIQTFETKTPIKIWSDSVYALSIMKGIWSPKANKSLAREVRKIFKICESKFKISLAHQFSHTGFLWNDRADQLAEIGHNTNGLFHEPNQIRPGIIQDLRAYRQSVY